MAEQLCMRCSRLNNLPDLCLPDGYSERSYREGDVQAWCQIISESFEESWDAARFKDYMLGDAAFRPERIRFLINAAGVPCATASAYRRHKYGPDSGYVHMVGVLSSEAGKRLGYAISLRVLQLFREEGCCDAVLQTDDFRLAAIKTYLNLGFQPLLVEEGQRDRWEKVYTELKLAVPVQWHSKSS